MDEHVVSGGALDKAVAFRSVEPFHCSFFLHRLSPENCAEPGAGPKRKKATRPAGSVPWSVAPLPTAESNRICLLRPQYRTANYVFSSASIPMVGFDLRDERAITERLRNAAVIPPGSPVVLGIGDDCAIYRPRGSADDLLFTTDLFLEGVHFLRETHKAAEAGRKALVRSLSDIAAMGGTPRFCLVSLCVPAWANAKWI